MIKRLTVAIFALSFALPVHAGETSAATRNLARQGLNTEALATAQGRRELIEAVRDYCAEIDAAYPKNSPSETEWLMGEVRGSGDRPVRAFGTAEMGRRMAANFTEGCSSWINEASREPDSPRVFTALAYVFVRFMPDAEVYARKNGIDPEKWGLDVVPRAAVESLLLAALNSDAHKQ